MFQDDEQFHNPDLHFKIEDLSTANFIEFCFICGVTGVLVYSYLTFLFG